MSHLPPVRTRTVERRRVRKLVESLVLKEEAGGLVKDAGSGKPFVGVGSVIPADEEVSAIDGVVGPVGDVVDAVENGRLLPRRF